MSGGGDAGRRHPPACPPACNINHLATMQRPLAGGALLLLPLHFFLFFFFCNISFCCTTHHHSRGNDLQPRSLSPCVASLPLLMCVCKEAADYSAKRTEEGSIQAKGMTCGGTYAAGATCCFTS